MASLESQTWRAREKAEAGIGVLQAVLASFANNSKRLELQLVLLATEPLLYTCVSVEAVRNPSGYTQRRLGIQGSVTSGPTRIILLAVCCRVLLRFANSLLLLEVCYCYIGL
jgi:hypothetical protein